MSDKSKRSNFTIAMQELLSGKLDSEPEKPAQKVPFEEDEPIVSDRMGYKPEPQKLFDPKDMIMKEEIVYEPYRPTSEPEPEPEDEERTDCSVITEDMVIIGTVSSRSDIDMRGTIQGNVSSLANVLINGTIEGDLAASNISVSKGAVQGKVASQENIIVDEKALVVGDITAVNAKASGRIKGDIQIERALEIGEEAVVFGDITSSSLIVKAGAVLKGHVEVTSRKISDDSFKFHQHV